jgi:hypothetical protein
VLANQAATATSPITSSASPHSMENNPFAVFTFLVAPAILTNACTVLALGTSNRLARAVDRTRAIANVLVAPPAADSGFTATATIPHELASAQFSAAAKRCRVLIRALRYFYLAVGCFAGGTCVAMLGATLGYFGNQQAANVAVVGMLSFAGVGVVSLVIGSACLVRESTLTLSLLIDEQAALSSLEKQIRQGKARPPGVPLPITRGPADGSGGPIP